MASGVFSQNPAISGSSFDYYYGAASQQSELLSRRDARDDLLGQGAFLGLLTKLNVPVLSRSANHTSEHGQLFVGAGSSYSVTQSLQSIQDLPPGRAGSDRDIGKELRSKKYVVKRIHPLPSHIASDRIQLSAIINEVRILANESLKKVPHLVRLIYVAWDEVPTLGRHWPRLLIEAADFGNLAEFMAVHEDSRGWDVKLELLVGILAGLNMLHNHHVAHCDLKLENVLVFRTEEGEEHPLGIEYRAKLCDFGFSVVLSDHKPGSTFSAIIGTEPWNAPELTFGTPIEIENLPMSDVFSFGLLFSRVLLHGGSPFEGLDRGEIRSLKRNSTTLAMFERVSSTIFGRVDYSQSQQLLIKKMLLVTLGEKPEHRFPLHLIGGELQLLGILFRDHDTSATDAEIHPEPSQRVSSDDPKGPRTAPTPSTFAVQVASISQKVFSPLVVPLWKLGRGMLDRSTWFLRSLLIKLGLIKHPFGDFLDPHPVVTVTPIAPLQGFPAALSEMTNGKSDDDNFGLPDFEGFGRTKTDLLPSPALKELMQDLQGRAKRGSSRESAEAAYQLSIAHFEGNCVAKDYGTSLEWLDRAASGGCEKAITGYTHIYESCDREASPSLKELVRTEMQRIAKSELLDSLGDTMTNTLSQRDCLLAIRQWADQDSTAYSRYITSPYFGTLSFAAVSVFTIWATMEDDNTAHFDFRLLEGYNHHDDKTFGPLDKIKFIESVKKYQCAEKTDAGRLTLLQKAAAEGNIVLATIMVEDLGAKVDGVGATPGFTPLWISCCTGNIEVASFLASHGADARCKDDLQSRTILHFLNKCKTKEELMTVLTMAIHAGVDLNVRDSNGNTPLLSTFIGADFSRGLAARRLLDLGVNVLVRSKQGFTPIGAAVRSLDVDLIRRLCQAFGQSLVKAGNTNRVVPDLSPEEAKCDGLLSLGNHTEFYNRRVRGKTAFSRLKCIVDLLIDESSRRAFSASNYSLGSNPLIAACFMGQDDLAAAVLESSHCPQIDDVDENGTTALHWAVERGKADITMELLRRNANPLAESKMGYNIFQLSAIHSPRLLLDILKAMDSGGVPRHGNTDASSILRYSPRRGESIFDKMVIEGSPEHLEVAECLRVIYNLPYDEFSVTSTGILSRSTVKMTPTAWLIDVANNSRLFSLRQFEYLLSLDPRPRFVADTDGATLLHHAVSSWDHDNLSSNPTAFAVLKLLLRCFPDVREHLETADKSGNTPLHIAACASNLTAVQIIYDHLATTGQTIDLNKVNNAGSTPLSCVGRLFRQAQLDEERYRPTKNSLQLRTVKMYEYLRNRGACFASEKISIMICLVYRSQDQLSKNVFLEFLEVTGRALGIPWEYAEADVENGAEGTSEAYFVLELGWCFDHFALRGTQMMTDTMGDYTAARMDHRLKAVRGAEHHPWLVADHEEVIFDHTVRWTRPGRLWTIEERKSVTSAVESAWNTLFPYGSTRLVVQI